jgi:hypothetical protein
VRHPYCCGVLTPRSRHASPFPPLPRSPVFCALLPPLQDAYQVPAAPSHDSIPEDDGEDEGEGDGLDDEMLLMDTMETTRNCALALCNFSGSEVGYRRPRHLDSCTCC